jgi:multidrug efflux pump subunit AcrA (membrane-fusion protein)
VSSQDKAHQTQTIVNTDYGYRTPYFESAAQYERAQISLIDQQFAQLMYGQNLPHLAQVFANELNNIDADVYRLQIAYLNTILMSPFAGTVTGLYKLPGDMVRAGEPVARVENNATVLLSATVAYREAIALGAAVTVNATLFDSIASPPITGTIVAARGRRDDENWEVVAQCVNPVSSGNPVLPPGYSFDPVNTTMTIA